MKISVILNDNETKRFDAYCHSHGYKKSTLIARLIREYLDRENFAMQQSLLQTPEIKLDGK
jgi:metal-responsive CopG/Arc/MetJ family transcriptional regulator